MKKDAAINVFDFTRLQLRELMQGRDYRKFHADQIIQWIHQKGVTDWALMTNLSQSLQQYMREHFCVEQPKIDSFTESSDGTIKFVIRLHDLNAVEAVYIPDKTRATLCVSSQVGCALNCSFCSTGKQGFNRNLSTGEIISQLWLVRAFLQQHRPDAQAISNVVLMGMGEPLLKLCASCWRT